MAAQRPTAGAGPSDGPGAGPPGRSYPRRRRRYLVLMTVCVVLFVSAWALVRLWSVPVAVGMCVVAMALPPLAAVIGNRREPGDRWWDEEDDTGGPGPGPGNGGSGPGCAPRP